MNTITIDSKIYKEAETYANKHNLSIKQLVEKYLAQLPKITITKGEKYKLPKHLDNMGGCLSDIADPNDEKLNYLLSNVQKITSAENLQSRASDEIVPFREFIIKDDTSALL